MWGLFVALSYPAASRCQECRSNGSMPPMRSRGRWITASGLVLAVLIGIFAGAGGFTFYTAKGYSYLSNDPRSCVNCHIMREQYDSWQKSSHHAFATCNDCHVPHDLIGKYTTKMENGYR